MPVRSTEQRPPRSNITLYFGLKETRPPSATPASATSSSGGQPQVNTGEGTASEQKRSLLSEATAHCSPKQQRTTSDEQTASAISAPDLVAEKEEKTKSTEATKQRLEEEGDKPRQRRLHDEGHQEPEEQCTPSRPTRTEPSMEIAQEQDPQSTKRHWVYIQGCSATELDQAIAELPANILETIEPRDQERPPPSTSLQRMAEGLNEAR